MMDEADATLRQQFQVLQERQQKKLMRHKQRQEEKIKKDLSKEAERSQDAETKGKAVEVNGFGIADDLGLKLSDPVTKNSMYQEHINEQLSDQIRELKDETGRLYKLLSERDYEIRKLKKQREQDRLALGGGGLANETAATKIVELSKKTRELTAELESEKTKSKQQLRKVRELEKELSQGAGRGSAKQRSPSPTQEQAAAQMAEMKATQDKLNQANSRLGEYRTQIASLKQELKVCHKVLSNEVGDGVNVQSLLYQPSGWRGRSQQVLLLQKKVDRLKSHLDQYQRARPDTELSLEDQFMTMDVTDDAISLASSSALPKTTRSVFSIDDKQRSRIRQLEKDRREAKEKASTDLKALEEDHARLKEKLEAGKARNKVLSAEIKSLKQQVGRCMDKGKHDDELIEALLKQQSQLKQSLEEASAKSQQTHQRRIQDAQSLEMRSQREANVVEQLKTILMEKEKKAKLLEEEIVEMRRQKQHVTGSDRPPSHQGFSLDPAATPIHRPPSHQGFTLDPSATPTNRPPSGDRRSHMAVASPAPPPSRHSLWTSSQLSHRSGSRQSIGDGDLPPRGSPLRTIRPSSTGSIASNSNEALESLRLQCQELKSTSQVAEVERDKLTELVTVLQKRLDECTTKAVDSQNSSHELKQKNVWLEKQLGRAKMEGGKGGKTTSAVISNKASHSLLGDDDLLKDGMPITLESIDSLQQRLAIQIDDNDALKAALQSTLKAKEEDLRLYHDMMDQTKRVFLQGLRQFRQNNQPS